MTGTSSTPRTRFTARFIALAALVGALSLGGVAVPANAAGGTFAAQLSSAATGGFLTNTTVEMHLWKHDGVTWQDLGSWFPAGNGLISITNRDPGSYRIEFRHGSNPLYAHGWYGTNNGFEFRESQAKTFVVTAAGEFFNFDTALPTNNAVESDWVDPAEPDGVPKPGVIPNLWRLLDGNWVDWNTTYGLEGLLSQGSVRFGNLPPGEYTIGYSDIHIPPNRYVDQWYNGEPDLVNARSFEVDNFSLVVLDTVTMRGPAFSDIVQGQPFFTEITWMQLQGISNGNVGAGGTLYYDATASVSRQSMAAFLYRAAGSPSFTPPSVATFSDVPVGHPFFKEIEWMSATGISHGNVDGTYGPAAPVSRQAMAAFLYRFSGSPAFTPPATATFTDVPVGAPFFLEVEWVKAAGIANGNVGGTYGPVDPVSRQSMAAFLFRQNNMVV